jgi:hypothetical protein
MNCEKPPELTKKYCDDCRYGKYRFSVTTFNPHNSCLKVIGKESADIPERHESIDVFAYPYKDNRKNNCKYFELPSKKTVWQRLWE